MPISTRARTAATLVGLLAAAAAIVAGPLTPPAGPVAPTFKTLAEVQPRTPVQSLPGSASAVHVISQPGSYYLTGNLVASPGTCGIRVLADNVSIDLCGFTIDASAGLNGVEAGSPSSPVAGLGVRNGVIVGGGNGVVAPAAEMSELESLRIRVTGDVGIRTGYGSIIRGCTIAAGEVGVYAEESVQVLDCWVSGAAECGYYLGEGSLASRCTSHNAANIGFLAAGGNSSIRDCVTRGGEIGVRLASGGNRVEGCKIGQTPLGIASDGANLIANNTINAAVGGQGKGILLYWSGTKVEGNNIYGFQYGVESAGTSANVVVRNTMHACTTPIGGPVSAMVAPVVTTAAALAGNPTANVAE